MENRNLVLTRKSGQELIFSIDIPGQEPVEVRQVFKDMQGAQTRVLIQAPSSVKVLRNELIETRT